VLVVVLVLENPDRFAIRLTEQISSIGLFAVTESQLYSALAPSSHRKRVRLNHSTADNVCSLGLPKLNYKQANNK
jgi:hypothetical protein